MSLPTNWSKIASSDNRIQPCLPTKKQTRLITFQTYFCVPFLLLHSCLVFTGDLTNCVLMLRNTNKVDWKDRIASHSASSQEIALPKSSLRFCNANVGRPGLCWLGPRFHKYRCTFSYSILFRDVSLLLSLFLYLSPKWPSLIMSLNVTNLPGIAPNVSILLKDCTPQLCSLNYATLKYIPSLPGNTGFMAIFIILLVGQSAWWFYRRTPSFTLLIWIGILLEIIGYSARINMHTNLFVQMPFLTYVYDQILYFGEEKADLGR